MLTAHDLANFEEIISGTYGDWFTAQLLRLIFKADAENKENLRLGFPYEVYVVELWQQRGGTEGWERFVKQVENKEQGEILNALDAMRERKENP